MDLEFCVDCSAEGRMWKLGGKQNFDLLRDVLVLDFNA